MKLLRVLEKIYSTKTFSGKVGSVYALVDYKRMFMFSYYVYKGT